MNSEFHFDRQQRKRTTISRRSVPEGHGKIFTGRKEAFSLSSCASIIGYGPKDVKMKFVFYGNVFAKQKTE